MNGTDIIIAERKRQLEEENYSSQNDDHYMVDELALAAASYAIPHRLRALKTSGELSKPYIFPWRMEYWKPTPDDRIRELAKAGALIAAEIDRLQRKYSEREKESQNV